MDRNDTVQVVIIVVNASLSARRAWIEITLVQIIISGYARSLSARRAWIEISTRSQPSRPKDVALRKESVDRNDTVQVIIIVVTGRSPHGERG